MLVIHYSVVYGEREPGQVVRLPLSVAKSRTRECRETLETTASRRTQAHGRIVEEMRFDMPRKV